MLPWKDKYLSPDSFVLVLGESLTGPVTVNLANIPHILLGGSTGSGKSVLLKLLLMQAVEKGGGGLHSGLQGRRRLPQGLAAEMPHVFPGG